MVGEGGGDWLSFQNFLKKEKEEERFMGVLSFQNFLKKGGGVQIFSIEREGLVK